MQTSLFKPVAVREKIIDEDLIKVVKILRDVDINSLTPVEAMKKLIEIKEILQNLKS